MHAVLVEKPGWCCPPPLRLSALHSFTYPGHHNGSGHLATAATAGARGQLAQFLDTTSVPAQPTTAQGGTTRRITYRDIQ